MSFFRTELAKEIAKAVVGLFLGYSAALLVTPDQLYQKIFLPNPDNFLGKWSGSVAGRDATLNITGQSTDHGNKITGSLTILDVSGPQTLEIQGSADSRFLISGKINKGRTLRISLQREVPDARGPGERDVLLNAVSGESAAIICPEMKSLIDGFSVDKCEKLDGDTFFFR